MSAHYHLRKEKNCLNCGHQVPENYCPNCGQLNREPILTLHDLVHDFIHMFTHFDGKFFQTIRVLFSKPGFLTRAYLDGKRIQFLPPVQLYVFTSALFFFVFYSFIVNVPDAENLDNNVNLKKQSDSSKIFLNLSGTDSLLITRFQTPEQYIRYQDSLPAANRDSYLNRLITSSEIKLNQRFSQNSGEATRDLINALLKNFPKLLFLSLPIMASILFLLFFKKKQFSFVTHLLFLLHLYVFTLISLLFSFGFEQLNTLTGWSIFFLIDAAIGLWIFVYGYKAMKNLYQLSRKRALFNYTIFLLSGLIVGTVLFIGDVLYALITV
jgi:hypothetical protein